MAPESQSLEDLFFFASLKICSAVTFVTLEILRYSLTGTVVLRGVFTRLHPCVQRKINEAKQLEQVVGACSSED